MSWRAFIAVLASGLVACGGEPGTPIVATDVEITPARPGVPMRAAYLAIANDSNVAVRITSVTSPQFGRVELHETVIENDVARMRRVDELTIAPRSELRLERGGMHLMLMQPRPEPADAITLNFHDGDRLLLSVTANQDGS